MKICFFSLTSVNTSSTEDLHQFCPVDTVKCLVPIYQTCTQLFFFVQSSCWYYSHHPKCMPVSFSHTKSKLILSKYILNFPSNPSTKYPPYYLCCMCDEADCAFWTFWFLLKVNHCNFGEKLRVTLQFRMSFWTSYLHRLTEIRWHFILSEYVPWFATLSVQCWKSRIVDVGL